MNYSVSDIGNMRRDALRRTREMHRQNSTYQEASKSGISSAAQAEKEYREEKQTAKKHSADIRRERGSDGILSGLFGGAPDNDKIIIIALIIILAKNGADLKLIIALGYILM